jgi:hypothetical protein
MPADRAEVDDRAPARGTHRRHDGLRGEEQVAQVGGDALVPECGRDASSRGGRLGCVVEQDVDAAEHRLGALECSCEGAVSRRSQRMKVHRPIRAASSRPASSSMSRKRLANLAAQSLDQRRARSPWRRR